MTLVVIIDLVIVLTLVTITMRKGLEQALPCFVFCAVLLPQESRIEVGFDLSSTRLAIATMLALFIACRKPPIMRQSPLKKLIISHICFIVASTAFSIVFITSVKQLL